MAKNFQILTDTDLNDVDKTFTVPSGQTYDVKWISVRLTTTAVVGNRLIRWELQNAAGTVVLTAGRTNPLTASDTWQVICDASSRIYAVNVNGLSIDADAHVFHLILPPDFKVAAGYKLRIYEQAAVDPTHDDMLVYLGVEIESL